MLLLLRHPNADCADFEVLNEAATLADMSALDASGVSCKCCLLCLMDNLVDRNSLRVAALIERGLRRLLIVEAVDIEAELRSIARFTSRNAIAIRRAIVALIEEGIRVMLEYRLIREELEVAKRLVAVIQKTVKLNRSIELSPERKLAVVDVAAEVVWREAD